MSNIITRLFGIRARDEPRDRLSPAMEFWTGRATSGQSVTQRSAVQISAVYACVRVIAETIASLPLHLYQREPNGSAHVADHPLDFMLHSEPNPEMTSYSWRETTMTHLLLWGNAYSQKIYNGAGRIIGLYPLLPERMDVDRDERGEIVYSYHTDDGQIAVMHRDTLLHIPGLGFDGLKGYSPVAMMRNTLGLSLAAEEYGATFFRNGATPAGVLKHPGRLQRRQDGSGGPEALRKQWQSLYSGKNNGRVAVLEEGMEYQRIAMPNNEAQFLETRKFQVAEIARIYRVPPHMIGDLEHATFSNIEHQSISFAQHTIRPWVIRLEQALDRGLLTEKEKPRYYTGFNLDGIQRGDYKSRMEGYAIARQNGWMSANDINRLENRDPIPAEQGGDLYLVNGNMITMAHAATNVVGGTPAEEAKK